MTKLICLLLLCASAWGDATVTAICAPTAVNSSTTVTCTTTTNVAAGSVIIVAVSQGYGAVQSTSVSDGTNTYTEDMVWPASGSSRYVKLYSTRLASQLNSGGTITLTVAAFQAWGMMAYGVSGLATSYVDTGARSANEASFANSLVSSTTGSVASVSACFANYSFVSSTGTAGNGYTKLNDFAAGGEQMVVMWKRVLSGTTYSQLDVSPASSGVVVLQCYAEASVSARRRVVIVQ